MIVKRDSIVFEKKKKQQQPEILTRSRRNQRRPYREDVRFEEEQEFDI